RVNRRMVDLADLLVAAEAESWPDKFADPADYRAFQRIVNRPEATHDTVRATHTRVTRDRMARADHVVLVLHDTTELDYSGRRVPARWHLGPRGRPGGGSLRVPPAVDHRGAVVRTPVEGEPAGRGVAEVARPGPPTPGPGGVARGGPDGRRADPPGETPGVLG